MSITPEIKKKAFEKFKAIYPTRNGRKLEMPLAEKKWLKYITSKDISLILSATTEFANSREVKAGNGIMNAHRFIRDGKGIEHWRDWIKVFTANELVKSTQSKPVTPEQIKDSKMRYSPEFQHKLHRKICNLWAKSKHLVRLNNAPCNMW